MKRSNVSQEKRKEVEMRMKKPICVKCEKEFYPFHNGAFLVELYHNNEFVYKIWHCDIYQCPKCEVKIVYGYGDNPIMTDGDGEKNCRDFIKLKKNVEFIVYEYE
jgi:RNase P subunit RPR2